MSPRINRYARSTDSSSLPATPAHAILPRFCTFATRQTRTGASVSWIVVNIHRTMILSGILTMTMAYTALASEAALRSTFGASVSGPVADIVVRNRGALIALIGAMLICGARKPAVRPMTLGNVIDEFFGELGFSVFFVLSGVGLSGHPRSPRWLSWWGIATGVLGLIGMWRNVTPAVDVVAAASNYLLPAWMIGFGVWLVIMSRTERPTPAHV
jgi:hypothetical protein